VDLARKNFLEDPLGAPLIPNWNRVIAAIPDFLNTLEAAVDQDNLPASTGAGRGVRYRFRADASFAKA
jgi:hypothetical protein